jgi:hypothetical protein
LFAVVVVDAAVVTVVVVVAAAVVVVVVYLYLYNNIQQTPHAWKDNHDTRECVYE